MQVVATGSDANVDASDKYSEKFTEAMDVAAKQRIEFDAKIKKFEEQRVKLEQTMANTRPGKDPKVDEQIAKEARQLQATGQNLQSEEVQLRENEQRMQQNIATVQRAADQDFGDLLVRAAEEVAKAKKLDLILVRQQNALFYDSSFDVSKDIITAMNRIWKAGGSKQLGADTANQIFKK
jgi:Skp family chaperone for outer membrane proteins